MMFSCIVSLTTFPFLHIYCTLNTLLFSYTKQSKRLWYALIYCVVNVMNKICHVCTNQIQIFNQQLPKVPELIFLKNCKLGKTVF